MRKLSEAKSKYDAGDFDEAMEALNEAQEKFGPGDVMCVLNSLREFQKGIPRLKDPGIKRSFQEILDPLIESAKSGEYRESCQGFNEVRPELLKIMFYYGGRRQKSDSQTRQKLDNLQQLMEQKFGNEAGGQLEGPSAPNPFRSNNPSPLPPSTPQKLPGASVLNSFFSWLKP